MARDNVSLLPEFVGSRYTVRLGVALALAILVVVVSGVIISNQAQATLQKDVENQLETTSLTRAQQLDTWIDSVKLQVKTTSKLPVFSSGNIEQINEQLNTMVASGDIPADVVAIHYLDTAEMTFLASSNPQFVGVRPIEEGAPFARNPPQFDGPDDVYVTRPFNVSVVDHPIMAVISPVDGADNRAVIYMVNVRSHAQSVTIGNVSTRKTVVVNDAGTVITSPNTNQIGTDYEHDIPRVSVGQTKFVTKDARLEAITKMQIKDWHVIVHTNKDVAYALGSQINADLIGLILLSVINLGLVGVTIGSGTAVSLRRLSTRAEAMANGDLDVTLRSTRDDEIGTVFRSFDRMRDSIRSNIQEAERARAEAEHAQNEAEEARKEAEREREEARRMNEQLQQKAAEYGDALSAVADGDLTVRADSNADNEAMVDIAESINAAIEDLERTIANTQSFAENVLESSEQVGKSAGTVDEASQQVRESIRDISDGASKQASNLQKAAGQMENLSATAEEVASSAQEIANTSTNAAKEGETGRQAAQEAIEGMNAIERETDATVAEINRLDEELDEIGEIIQVITEIAEQTNILALNASIEAARADGDGNSGDGFAVVAEEVKNLAAETKDAAVDIENRIDRVQSQASETVETMETTQQRIVDGVDTVENTVESLETIVEYTEELDTGIQEIDDATAEQARTAQDVMQMIDELTTISEETSTQATTVAEAADEQSDSIREVAQNAEALNTRAQELSNLLDRFEADSITASEEMSEQIVTTDDD